MELNTQEKFLIEWNNRFPRDRAYRKKHGIAFGSKEHRELNQIDIYLDNVEDKLFEKLISTYQDEKNDQDAYRKDGIWLKDNIAVGTKEFDKLFDDIKF